MTRAPRVVLAVLGAALALSTSAALPAAAAKPERTADPTFVAGPTFTADGNECTISATLDPQSGLKKPVRVSIQWFEMSSFPNNIYDFQNLIVDKYRPGDPIEFELTAGTNQAEAGWQLLVTVSDKKGNLARVNFDYQGSGCPVS